MDTTYGNQGPYFSVDESVRHMAGSPLEPFALPVPVDERPHDEMLLRFSPILHLNDTGKSMSEPTLDSRATSTVVSPASQSYARRNSRFAAKKSVVILPIFLKDPFRGATRMKSARFIRTSFRTRHRWLSPLFSFSPISPFRIQIDRSRR